MQKFRIGLTGGIGSGKSVVSTMLSHKGIVIIDADAVSRQLTAAEGLAIAAIKDRFGDDMITDAGALDRLKMRELIFNQPHQRKALEAIMHPLIQEQCQRLDEQVSSPYVVHDVPLLIESIAYYRPLFNRICVVDCDKATQIARVQARNHLSNQQIELIMQAQATREQRLQYADDVILNDGLTNLSQLQEQVDAMHSFWLNLANDSG